MKDGKKAQKVIKINNKNYTINIQRLAISLLVIIALVIVIVKLVSPAKEIKTGTKIDDLNAKKYADLILLEYEKNGQKEMFLSDYEKVQTKIGVYILNNSTLDDNSFSKISKDLNKELSKDKWGLIDIERPTNWNGKWSINEQGILKFKFNNKDIEPSWKNDTELQNKLIIN